MQWLELHNVEYGECIVLGGKQDDILMVDCGSINQKIREGDVDFQSYVDPAILDRYLSCRGRSFLLTHYHRDHLCGLFPLLRKNNAYFDRVFLPVSPSGARGKPLLLEFALFMLAFRDAAEPAPNPEEQQEDELAPQSGYARVNGSSLRIFSRVAKLAGAEHVFPVRAGSRFQFDGITYEALWPDAENYPFTGLFSSFVEEMNICLSSPYLPDAARDFMKWKDEFCEAYRSMCADTPVKQEKLEILDGILAKIVQAAPEISLLPCAPDVVRILSSDMTKQAYTDELNAASVIFHNIRTKEASFDDILMTGDAAPESMDAVAERLYGGYYIIKAPHHGTASHWSHIFEEIGASHILISNGEYQKGGKIAQEYIDLEAVKHCTNCSVCAWFQSSGCSCNRMACCYDIPTGAGLTIKCPRCTKQTGAAPCNIYVMSSNGSRSCLCDEAVPRYPV